MSPNSRYIVRVVKDNDVFCSQEIVTNKIANTNNYYEAESESNTRNGSIVAERAGCSNGKYVGWVGNGNSLQFNNVVVDESGYYNLKVNYITGEDRGTRIDVNGQTGGLLNFSNTGSWTTVGSKDVTVYLNAVSNALKFYTNAGEGWAPDFDRTLQENLD